MNFQYQYELGALVLLICLAIQFYTTKRFPTKTNAIFSTMIICAIVDISLDIIGCIFIVYPNIIPLWLNYALNIVFFSMQITIPVIFFSYVLYNVGKSYSENPLHIILLLPACITMVVNVTTPLTGWIFGFPIIDGQLQYVRGLLFPMLYVSEGFYLICVLLWVIIYRRYLKKNQRLTIISFLVLIVITSVIQFFFKDLLLTGTAIVISIMLMNFTLQNPEAMLDSTTRAFNREALVTYISGEIARKRKLHMIIIDIDGLGSADRHNGLKLGQALEEDVGIFFESISKKRRNWYFRLDKSRFVIFAKDLNEQHALTKVINDRFNQPWHVANITFELIAKVLEVNTNTSIQFSTSELFTVIDDLLGSDKLLNTHVLNSVFDSVILSKYRRKQLIEESLRKSVKTNEGLYLCYQPIVPENGSNDIIAEALLRYNDQNLGAVSPGEFIPIAEECGLATFLDAFAIREGCKMLKECPQINLLHINLSATEFYTNPASKILDIVQSMEIEPKRICFEITETSAAKYPDVIRAFMEQMLSLGYCFALDDYGTGYANARQVILLPFKTIKIDKVLLDSSHDAQIFLASVLKMFKDIGKETVIEGVETKEQFDRVVEQGADMIQGFLLSPPLTSKDYIKFFTNQLNK